MRTREEFYAELNLIAKKNADISIEYFGLRLFDINAHAELLYEVYKMALEDYRNVTLK